MLRSNRHAHRRLTKLGALHGTVKVTLTEDGVLKTIGRKTTRWIKVKPLTFREEYGLRTLAFREDKRGRITHMFIGDLPFIAYERTRIEDSAKLHLGITIITTLLFLITVVFWPVATFIRWRHGVKLDPKTRIPRFAYLITWGASLLFIVGVISLAVVFRDPYKVMFGIPIALKVILVLPLLAVVLLLAVVMTIGTLIYTLVIWKSGKGSIGGRIYYSAVMIALIVALWQLNHWKLLGFHY